MSGRGAGTLLVVAGVLLVVVGLLVWSGALAWFGRLPGDVRIERDQARVYIPITSTILVSVLLSVLLYLARRLY